MRPLSLDTLSGQILAALSSGEMTKVALADALKMTNGRRLKDCLAQMKHMGRIKSRQDRLGVRGSARVYYYIPEAVLVPSMRLGAWIAPHATGSRPEDVLRLI